MNEAEHDEAETAACTRCREEVLRASTRVDDEGGRSVTTRVLECPRCGYRRTWVTITVAA
jgi:DNA-directed RNA polymerase subunit RPC12/RpoP